MNSCFYVGRVRHRRFTPRRHEFNYRLFYVYLDLDELGTVFSKRWLWSVKRPALARFKRDDYFGDQEKPLKQAVTEHVEQETGKKPQGPIRMLTHLRYFGYVFNPVTFYYCFDKSDSYVETIVAEITNTPWGEKHAYVLPQEENILDKKMMKFRMNKEFHVSPFMHMNIQYDWRFSLPGELLNVHMNNHEGENKIFDAILRMEKQPITARNCAYVLTTFPFMTMKVISGIYWQAFRLFLKRTPFYTHPSNLNTGSDKKPSSSIKQEVI